MSGTNALTLIASSDRENHPYAKLRCAAQPRVRGLDQAGAGEALVLGPPGWAMPVCEIDLRVGGKYRYVWRHTDGREMGMGGIYNEIARPDRFVHTEKFDTAWYPGEALITTVLAEQSGKTTLTAAMLYESREARDSVLTSGMEDGVAASYDRLEELLVSKAA